MRKPALLAIALTAAAGIAGAALWTRPPMPEPPPADEGDGKNEADALAASNGLASRSGASLSLRLKSGETLALTDRIACGDLPCPKELATRYRYRGWDPAHGGFLLQIAGPNAEQMILPYGEEDPILVDVRHAQIADRPFPMPLPPPAVATDESLGEWLTDIAGGRSQSEAPLIGASQGKVKRQGPVLSLQLADGRRFDLTDDLACGQVSCPPQIFRSFDYAGRSPDRRFDVIEVRWDEASAALLVDTRSGAVTLMLGVPKFSPDGKRAVASVTDLEWSAPRRLEVWSLGGTAPGLEFSLSAKDEDDTVYQVKNWDDGDHLRLQRGAWASTQRSDVMLVHDAEGWHMEGGDGAN